MASSASPMLGNSITLPSGRTNGLDLPIASVVVDVSVHDALATLTTEIFEVLKGRRSDQANTSSQNTRKADPAPVAVRCCCHEDEMWRSASHVPPH